MDIKEKSVVETNISISVRGTRGTKRVKFINKKGTFQYRKQCKTCQHKGMVVAGLGGHKEPTCDRDGTTWRMMNGISEKDCKFYKQEANDGRTGTD